jgi:N-acyl-D-amino-acid deacylase
VDIFFYQKEKRLNMVKKSLVILGIFVLAMIGFFACSKSDRGKFDILVQNGKIIDGTGNPWFYGDVGIIGDTIAEIGDLSGKTAVRTIDAKGMVISPGFIDIHTHCEEGLGKPGSNANLNYLMQGTTTVVTGNCGSGIVKIAETKAELENQGIGTNAIALFGYCDALEEVVGMEPRPPTQEELVKIKEIVRQAMVEGAWGLSTGLENHVPGRFSTTEELIEVMKVVGEYGGIFSNHQRDECDRVPESTRETIRIAEETGVRSNVTHFKVGRKNYWGDMKEAVELINEARARGIYVVADIYPYHHASMDPIISIEQNAGWAPFHIPDDMEPFAELRERLKDESLTDAQKNELKDKYIEELANVLSDPSKRERIRKSVLEGKPHLPSSIALGGWDGCLITAAKKNSHLIGRILSDVAEEQNRDPFDLAVELVLDEPDMDVAMGVMSEDNMKLAMKNDWLMFCSDGYAWPIAKEADPPRVWHPRDFGAQARILRKFVREEKVLTLRNAIRKMTSLPASFLQMKDRGLLKSGYKADLAIFDPETIRENSTHSDAFQYSTGTEFVIVNGRIGIENGEYTGALAGKLLLLTENK